MTLKMNIDKFEYFFNMSNIEWLDEKKNKILWNFTCIKTLEN